MKKDFLENCKQTLGNKIDDFIRTKSPHKGKKARIKFAEAVNALLNIENFDEQANYKKVSRWIVHETFPDLITVIAISKVMGVSLDELFNENIVSLSKISQLSTEERNTLKRLLPHTNKKNNTVSVYIPYSFNGKELHLQNSILSKDEIVNLFKENATMNFVLNKLNYYDEIKQKSKNFSPEKFFSKECSVAFIDSDTIELPESFYMHDEGYPDELRDIFYSGTDEYYEKISKLWEITGQNNFFNAIFFFARKFDYNNSAITDIDKANYYKSKSIAEKHYNKFFSSLIKKGILKPIEYDFTFYASDYETAFGLKAEDGEQTISIGKVLSLFSDFDHEYNLETISFNFKINLSEIQIQELLRGEF